LLGKWGVEHPLHSILFNEAACAPENSTKFDILPEDLGPEEWGGYVRSVERAMSKAEFTDLKRFINSTGRDGGMSLANVYRGGEGLELEKWKLFLRIFLIPCS
jgi:hypothetical protein